MLPYEKLLRANVSIFYDKGNNQIEKLFRYLTINMILHQIKRI